MGGSAMSGNNAQIFALLSKYGKGGAVAPFGDDTTPPDGDGTPPPAPTPPTHARTAGSITQQGFQNAFNNYLHNSLNGGFQGVMGFPDMEGGPMGAYGRRGGGGGGGNKKPPVTPPAPQTMNWQFPQYTQTWAFTPPTPPPYTLPPPFDTKKFGDPLKGTKKK